MIKGACMNKIYLVFIGLVIFSRSSVVNCDGDSGKHCRSGLTIVIPADDGIRRSKCLTPEVSPTWRRPDWREKKERR